MADQRNQGAQGGAGRDPLDGDETVAMPAPESGGGPAPAPDDDDELERLAMQFAGTGEQRRAAPSSVATMMMDPVSAPRQDGPKPVVIKGGPRRVVRADGRAPMVGKAQGQRRFALSSGHRMFVRPRHTSRVVASIVGVAAIVAIAIVILAAWRWSQDSLYHDEAESLVGTNSYDYGISLTPADDGGYYTAVLVTADSSDVTQIGDLEQVMLYRTVERPDKQSFSGAVRVDVPTNLAVSSTSSDNATTTVSLSQTLADRGVVRALTGIDTAFNLRTYNVVVADEDAYATIAGLLDGSTQASAVDAQSLLGHVRSNLDLQGVVDYAARVGTAAGASIAAFAAPTTPVTASDGATLAAGSPDQFLAVLQSVLAGAPAAPADATAPDAVATDEAGNPVSA